MTERKVLRQMFGLVLVIVMVFLSACGTNSKNDEKSSEGTNDVKMISLRSVEGAMSETDVVLEEAYVECENCISEIYKEIEEYENRGYENEGDIATSVEKIAELAETWKADGTVNNVTKHESYVYIEFSSGIKYFFAPALPGTSAVGSDTHVSVFSLQPAKSEFASRNKETETADNNATDIAAKKIDETYDNYAWEYDLDDKELTLQAVADLGADEVVLWNGHGGWFEECGSVLVLSETVKDVRYIGEDIMYIVNEGNYLVTSYFVDRYIGNLTNTFLYFSTCSGLRDTGLADSFKNKGAAAIVANTDVITTIYTSNVMAAVVDALLEGSNLDTSMAIAKGQYGERDSVLYTEMGALDYAVPTVYFGGDYKFSDENNAVDLLDIYINYFNEGDGFEAPENAYVLRENDMIEYYVVDGIECFSYEGLDNGQITYFAYVDGVKLCALYPGQERGVVEQLLSNQGFIKSENNNSSMDDAMHYVFGENGQVSTTEGDSNSSEDSELYKKETGGNCGQYICLVVNYDGDTVKSISASIMYSNAG